MAFIGCGKKEFTVNFDTAGGSNIKSIKIKDGEKLKLPKDPNREGYIFKGWSIDGKEFKNSKKIKENITLKAVWEEVKKEETDDKEDIRKKEPVKLSCPNGFNLVNGKCQRKLEINATPCEDGYKLLNGKCTADVVFEPLRIDCNSRLTTIDTSYYSIASETPSNCKPDYSIQGGVCEAPIADPNVKKPADNCLGARVYYTSYGTSWCASHITQMGNCTDYGGTKVYVEGNYLCLDLNDKVPVTCPKVEGYHGYAGSNKMCSYFKTEPLKLQCPTESNLPHNGKCYKFENEQGYRCSGGTLNETTKKCSKTIVKDVEYSCSSGYTLSGTKCYKYEYTNPR